MVTFSVYILPIAVRPLLIINKYGTKNPFSDLQFQTTNAFSILGDGKLNCLLWCLIAQLWTLVFVVFEGKNFKKIYPFFIRSFWLAKISFWVLLERILRENTYLLDDPCLLFVRSFLYQHLIRVMKNMSNKNTKTILLLNKAITFWRHPLLVTPFWKSLTFDDKKPNNHSN